MIDDASGRDRPRLRKPARAEVAELARADYLDLSDDEVDEIAHCVSEMIAIVDELMALGVEEVAISPATTRGSVRRPTLAEDPYKVFTHICDVWRTDSGLLAGCTVGVKDNIDVAGVPTSNASNSLPYVPTADAAVVERILNAGGRITGKLNMDNYAFGATGETSAFGAPRNPVDPTRSAGGSSGGSGAAVRAGAVDLALGGDQGGSARIPASYCGVVALKASHGLIPSHGMTHLDHTFDSIVPLGRDVEGVARLLTAIAGEDPRDPQWVRGPISTQDYLSALEESPQNLSGMTVGVVRESMLEDLCDATVLTNMRTTAAGLADLGAIVRDVSIPLWTHGSPITQTLLAHSASAMVRSEGDGYGHLGLISVERLHAFALKRRLEGRFFPIYLKTWLVTSRYLHERYFNVPYAVLHNLRRALRYDIDRALDDCNILLTPTTPTTAPPLLESHASDTEVVKRVLGNVPYNTAPLNVSGHPALAVPNGVDASGLPTSAQVIGRRLAEPVVLRIGRIIEEQVLAAAQDGSGAGTPRMA